MRESFPQVLLFECYKVFLIQRIVNDIEDVSMKREKQ